MDGVPGKEYEGEGDPQELKILPVEIQAGFSAPEGKTSVPDLPHLPEAISALTLLLCLSSQELKIPPEVQFHFISRDCYPLVG